jgi:hypothetical protein
VFASAAALALGWFALAPSAAVHANGVPTIVKLAYLDDLSNWGPREATGTLELALGEGYAKVDAAGMQRLDRKRYQGWLVNSQSNDAISVGTFNATANGGVTHRGTLPPLSNFGFDLFILTVEPEPDDAPQPTSERSIGGRFSLVGQRIADGSLPGEVLGGPRTLPNTGDGSWQADLLRAGLLLAALGLSLGAGLRLGRRQA